jgi:photosystem II stability/assembly factor-like uncharacterized protein
MRRIVIAVIAVSLPVLLAACGESRTSTPTAAVPSPTSAPATATIGVATSTPSPAASGTVAPAPTPSGAAVDPCTLRISLEGRPLSPGPSFVLDANTRWELCLGGVAAGSGEKFLFHTTDGGATWTLISRTTLGNPTPEAGVGELPNGNAVVQILFLDTTHGWMGLNSPGVNLYRSQDGGVTWTEVTVAPPGVPVTSISFSDAMHGTVVTPEGAWTTSDGGTTWMQ